MAQVLQADPLPLRLDEDGTIRVGDSRITLDVIVEDHERGLRPEQIVDEHDMLTLADVYGVIAYYMRHRDEVQDYLHRREEQAAEANRFFEARQPNRAGLKAELLARRR
jgi:uncharacterized protein (DUF433 family)